MIKPYLSIVIPAHNSGLTIGTLLSGIFASGIHNYEVIVVDDASGDKTREVAEVFRKKRKNLLILDLKKNGGPARARNRGAKKARGEILLFLDSDVRVGENTLQKVIDYFQEDKYRVAVTGVWDKKQSTNKFFPQFKALRDWSYWINEKKADAYYYLFSTRIAAIRRDVFEKLGGFSESFSGADVEDIEFTYRIAQKYRVDFVPEMVVYHDFEGFFPIANKYFRRSYQWIMLFLGRKKFDPVAATGGEALASLTVIGLIFSLVIGLIYQQFLLITLLFLVWHVFIIKKFLLFVLKEKGLRFMLDSFFTGLVLYVVIFTGAIYGFIKYYRR